MFRLFVVFLMGAVLYGAPVNAYECPKKVSYVAGDRLTQLLTPIIKDVYRALKCPTQFVALSGRAATQSFVMGNVDGESFRLDFIEAKYPHNYIRSSVSLFPLTGSLWFNPEDRSERPFGYAAGIAWEEAYAAGKKAVALRAMEQKIIAYNNHQISGFLMTDVVAQKMSDRGELTPAPVRKNLIFSKPAYHYLHEDYKAFMQAFSDYVRSYRPFQQISLAKRYNY